MAIKWNEGCFELIEAFMMKKNEFESHKDAFADEEKFPLTIAAKHAFAIHRVRPPSRATLFRWIRKGKLGIKLQSRRFNGGYQTSVEAIHRFVAAVDEAAAPVERVRQRRKQQLDNISIELDRLGIR